MCEQECSVLTSLIQLVTRYSINLSQSHNMPPGAPNSSYDLADAWELLMGNVWVSTTHEQRLVYGTFRLVRTFEGRLLDFKTSPID